MSASNNPTSDTPAAEPAAPSNVGGSTSQTLTERLRASVPNRHKPYQLALSAGASRDDVIKIADVFKDLSLDAPTAEALLGRLGDLNLTPADMRSKILFAADGRVDTALVGYAGVCGFASRLVDVATPAGLAQCAARYGSARKLVKDVRRPEVRPDRVRVVPSAEHPAANPDLPVVDADGNEADGEVTVVVVDPMAKLGDLDADVVSAVRFGRSVEMVAPGHVVTAIAQFVTVAGLRRRKDGDRYPQLLVPSDDGVSVVDLDGVRSQAGELRRQLRPYVSDVAPKVAAGERVVRLQEAAERDAFEVLRLLGSTSALEMAAAEGETLEGEQAEKAAALWRCVRPERHRNGDMNPSMRVSDGKIRCFRCDGEYVDVVRLTADALGVSADEAADVLLGENAAWADKVLAQRHDLF